MIFTPNWKKLGLESKDAGLKKALSALHENRKAILKHGLKDADGPALLIKGRQFILTERGFKET